jgi:RES domain-containing protein
MAAGWRIVKSRHASTAFDGEGARLYGGRWNSPGTRMVYTSSTISLAILEILVHLQEASLLLLLLLSSYSLISADFDDALVERLDHSMLPDGWRTYPAPSELQRIGDEWVQSHRSAMLEVPSVIVERESNYLLNPTHPDFSSVVIGEPEPFAFDERLLAGPDDTPDNK